MKNDAYKDTFLSTPYSERIILFPQCLRHPDCEANQDQWGYKCVDCGRCGISRIKKLAEELGYAKMFIVRGGSVIELIFKEFKKVVKAVIGIACNKEVFLGNLVCEKHGIVTQSVFLTREGCYNTDVNFKQVENCVKAFDSFKEKRISEKDEVLQ